MDLGVIEINHWVNLASTDKVFLRNENLLIWLSLTWSFKSQPQSILVSCNNTKSLWVKSETS
jgi:hypothetical protein